MLVEDVPDRAEDLRHGGEVQVRPKGDGGRRRAGAIFLLFLSFSSRRPPDKFHIIAPPNLIGFFIRNML